ncbi:MAG: tyrosine-type recombinase/integrase [Alphaproteobacteria bacterium]
MPLKDIQIKNAEIRSKQYKLSDEKGLYVLVRPSGSKLWQMKYRFQGKEKVLSFGPYPEVSLKEARERRDDARKLLRDEIDPLQQKKAEKLKQIDHSTTFEAVALEWYENRKERWTKSYAEDVIKRLKKEIFPHIGSLPIRDIEPPMLLEVIRKIENRGALELAERQLQKCGEIFRYGIACGKVIRDPSNDIKEALKPKIKGHYAALDVKELPDFIHTLERNDARLYRTTQNAMKLMMLVFLRTSELIGARWEEFDFERKEWLVPAERMKMKKEHIVPLARQTIELLEEQRSIAGHYDLVFPSPVKPLQSISNNTLLGAIRRMGYKGRMTGHGFRALAMSSIKQELGWRHEVIDRQLAHAKKNKIDAAYDRAMFLDDRKMMMQEWADYLDEIV